MSYAANKELTDDDMINIIKAEVERRGIYGNYIDGYSEFLISGIKDVITKSFVIEKEFMPNKDGSQPDVEKFYFKVEITEVKVTPPATVDYNKSSKIPLYPTQARLNNLTYDGQIYIDAMITVKAYYLDSSVPKVRTHNMTNFPLARIPIMTHCKLCNLYGKTREELINLGEDPNTYGATFIINGIEWTVATIENTTFNAPRIYRQKNYQTEKVRADLISKLGDGYENSSAIKVILHTDGKIVCHLTSSLASDYIIPFYIIFRIFGATNDLDIYNYITLGDTGNTAILLEKMLYNAMNAQYKKFLGAKNKRNIIDILDLLAEELFPSSLDKKDELKQNTLKAIYNKVYEKLDEKFLPHIGKTSAARGRKMQYLGILIRKVLLVDLGVLESTDRDTYVLKRLHGPGPSIVKAFKQHYNLSVVKKISTYIMSQMQKYGVETIAIGDIFENAVNNSDFNKAIGKAIASGTDSELNVGSTSITNRLRTKQVQSQNHLHVLSIISNIESTSASSVQSGSERSEEMRAFHSSSIGYLCPIQSPSGKNVGIAKQPAITMCITLSSPGHLLESRLLEDKLVVPYSHIFPKDLYSYYPITTIYVNGRPVGYVQKTPELITTYKELRRTGDIDIFTTIYWNTNSNELEFWSDYGRVIRPLLRVFYDKDVGYIKYTKQDAYDLATHKIGIMDLARRGVLEYISAEEQRNCLIAQSIHHLLMKQDPTVPPIRYTHCEIPQALLGIPILTSPFGNYNYQTKLILQGSQARQTNGYKFNYPNCIEKSLHMQHYNEIPIVRTLAYDYTPPNGINIVVAFLISNGYNQEDSLVVNKGAVDRGMFECSTFTYAKTELSRGDSARKPDPATTMDMKAHANYDKLNEYGYPVPGTLIQKNDVIIGKVSPIPKTSAHRSKYEWVDKSIIHNDNEEYFIVRVIMDRDGNDQYFIKVQMRTVRSVLVGDKFSSREGQKGVVGLIDREVNMPFTESGIVPDILFDPQGLITRKTMSQMLEGVVATWCARRGVITDGTTFKNIDIRAIQKRMQDAKLNPNCLERLYHGITGEPYDRAICVNLTFYQRLQKFPSETLQAMSRGPSDTRYKQPISGNRGGRRLGEMECNVIYSNGSCRFVEEKLSKHSDGIIDYYCKNCSSRAVANHNFGVYSCPICTDTLNLVGVRTSWTSKLMLQNLEGSGVNIDLEFDTNGYVE